MSGPNRYHLLTSGVGEIQRSELRRATGQAHRRRDATKQSSTREDPLEHLGQKNHRARTPEADARKRERAELTLRLVNYREADSTLLVFEVRVSLGGFESS